MVKSASSAADCESDTAACNRRPDVGAGGSAPVGASFLVDGSGQQDDVRVLLLFFLR
jgi:hypothetical protein